MNNKKKNLLAAKLPVVLNNTFMARQTFKTIVTVDFFIECTRSSNRFIYLEDLRISTLCVIRV